MCDVIAAHPQLVSAGFNDLDAAALTRATVQQPARLGPDRFRTLARMAEQAIATWRYERQFHPV